MEVPGIELNHLFQACDQHRRGFIGRDEFAELCETFEIGRDDADVIFADLDRDRDQRISLEDFTHGFREFLGFSAVSNSKRREDQTSEEKQKRRLKKQASIQAWRQLTARVGKDAIGRLLANSADELYVLYAELHETEASAQIVMQFEHLMESLLTDARQLEKERAQLQEAMQREREQHRAHLKSLEEEIEGQVQRVAQSVRQDAESKFEMEKREIQTKLEAEIAQLQTHLRLFQKVENWLHHEQQVDSSSNLESVRRAAEENRQLRLSLTEAQTTLALLQTELAQLKSDYIAKERFLSSEKETVTDLMSDQEHVTQQLELLHDANRQLQDTNDSLRACMADIGRRSPIGSTCTPRRSCFSSPFLAPPSEADPAFMAQFRYSTRSQASSIRQELDAISFSSSSPIDSLVTNNELPVTNSNAQWEANGPPDRTFKVVFAGDAAVGKSSFIKRACEGVFVNQTNSTLGVDFRVKTIRVDERNVAIQLWDTAGQERFRSITQSYFRKADGVLLMFDVTNEHSFLNVRSWCDSVNECIGRSRASSTSVGPFPVLLCGTKSDLRQTSENSDASRKVCIESDDAERLAAQIGSRYVETSAKTGHNILETLVLLTRQMLTFQDKEVQTLRLGDHVSRRNRCCTS